MSAKRLKKSLRKSKNKRKKSPKRYVKKFAAAAKRRHNTLNILLACHLPKDRPVVLFKVVSKGIELSGLDPEHTFYVDTGEQSVEKRIEEVKDQLGLYNVFPGWNYIPSKSLNIIVNCNCPMISTSLNEKYTEIRHIDNWFNENPLPTIWKNFYYDSYDILTSGGCLQIYIGRITDIAQKEDERTFTNIHRITGETIIVKCRTLEEVKPSIERRFELIKTYCEERLGKMPPWRMEVTSVANQEWIYMTSEKIDIFADGYKKMGDSTPYEFVINFYKK